MQRWRATFEGWRLPKANLAGTLLAVRAPRGPFEIEIQQHHGHAGDRYVAIVLPTLKKLRPRPWLNLLDAKQTVNAMFERSVEPWHEVK